MTADDTTWTPRYPVYVPSKSRFEYNRAYTARRLADDKVDFRLVVEEHERDQYLDLVRAVGGRDEQVLVLPPEYLRTCREDRDQGGSIPARNWIKEHSIQEGHKRHWQLDDNIEVFRRLWKTKRIPVAAGTALRACEDFTDRYENVAISGLNYQMFVGAWTARPYYFNVHVYSCLAPATPVLCADLVWRPAGELRVGQELVAFDDEPQRITGCRGEGGRDARSYRTAVVQGNKPTMKTSYRVSTDVGIPVEASEEHPWLVWRRPSRSDRWHDRPGEESTLISRLVWVETRDLRVGDRIAHLMKPWQRDETHDGGWISGMFDGEGSMVIRTAGGGTWPCTERIEDRPADLRTTGAGIGIAQKEGLVLDRLRTALIERGYDVWMGPNGNRSGGTHIRGGFREMLRFAGEFQPTRIVDRAPALWEGRRVWRGTTYELATVTSIEPLGVREVASIQTSTGTFITGGYLTHNCSLVDNFATQVSGEPLQWRGRYNEDTDICLQALTAGWCTVLINVFSANKITTMVTGGGNTDQLYKLDGRHEMAWELAKRWPERIVRVDRRWGRVQHVVNWNAFRPKELTPQVSLLAGRHDDGTEHRVADPVFHNKLERDSEFDFDSLFPVDERGLKMRAQREHVRSARLRKMAAEFNESAEHDELYDEGSADGVSTEGQAPPGGLERISPRQQ